LFWNAFAAHGERAIAIAKLLLELTESPARAEELMPRISAVEREADEITHEVMRALHGTWITPLDREEIHELIKSLDDVVDAIEGLAERFRVYGVKAPRIGALDMAHNIVRACEAMNEAVHLLKNMKMAPRLIELIRIIGEEEHQSDKSLAVSLKKLFEEEKDAIEVLKWRDLYERLERATDRTLDVANILEAIVLEHA
jgi:predicted phosphate transport protein (TIGR00153 family)